MFYLRCLTRSESSYAILFIHKFLVSILTNVMVKSEADTQRCSVKKVLLEILQISQENTCNRVFF